MFYLLPYKNVSKEYLTDRIRLYGGRVDRNHRDIYTKDGLKGLDVIITEIPAELEKVLKNDSIKIRSYQWLQKQLELYVPVV